MKRTRIERRTPLARGKDLSPVSRKQRRRIARYAAARARVLVEAEGRCERCGGVAEVTHHKAGRGGERMWDESLLVALCSQCHATVHANPKQSYADGWMVRRTREVWP